MRLCFFFFFWHSQSCTEAAGETGSRLVGLCRGHMRNAVRTCSSAARLPPHACAGEAAVTGRTCVTSAEEAWRSLGGTGANVSDATTMRDEFLTVGLLGKNV